MNTPARTYSRPRPSRLRALAALCARRSGSSASPPRRPPPRRRSTGKFDVSGVGTNNEITKGPDGQHLGDARSDQRHRRDHAEGQGQGVRRASTSTTRSGSPPAPAAPSGSPSPTASPSSTRAIRTRPRSSRSTTSPTRGRSSRGPDGNMWTVSGEQRDPDPARRPDERRRRSRSSSPAATSIAGKDGKLWVADFGGQVVRVKTDGTAKAYDTGAGSGLQAIAAGPKGEVGYADPTSNPQIASAASSAARSRSRRRPAIRSASPTRRAPTGCRDSHPATCSALDAERQALGPGRPRRRTPGRGGSPPAPSTPSG